MPPPAPTKNRRSGARVATQRRSFGGFEECGLYRLRKELNETTVLKEHGFIRAEKVS
jgi:hypothetical protein